MHVARATSNAAEDETPAPTGMSERIGSLESHLGTPQLGELDVHSGGVATPRRTPFVEQTVRGEPRHALEPLRAQDGSAVDSRRDVERHITVDRGGQYETA